MLPRYIAHRGSPVLAPENTLASMKLAKEQGAQWVEFDVQLTKDEAVVVIHDDKVDRTTNASGYVRDFLCSDLLALDAGSYQSPSFSDEKIPEFTAFICYLAELGLNMNVELKSSKGSEALITQKVLETLKQHWPSNLALPILSSFNPEIMLTLKKSQSPYPLAVLMHEWHEDWQDFAATIEPVSVNVNQSILTEARVKSIKTAGYGVLSYTVNTKEQAETFFTWGVDGIFTDNIELFSSQIFDEGS